MRRVWKGGIPAILMTALAADARGQSTGGVVQLSRELRSEDRTGEIRDVDFDRLDVAIRRAVPLGELKERAVPRARRRGETPGRLDRAVLNREVKAQLQDFELCRVKVARLADIPLHEVKAGRITARWTILPSGDIRDTLVLEQTDTALGLMKCARRRMNAWRFTPAVGGPVEVAFQYDFSRDLLRAVTAEGSERSTAVPSR